MDQGILGDPHATKTNQVEQHSNVEPKANMKTVQLTPNTKVNVPEDSPVKDLPR
ncbi:hypothetical protein GTO89_00280 [Heliobacterium gestii]|uniref:Uncharacterized protein n=1 Tax=Heliomicrobium gestii TaxID=2699 RepID=A0A845L5H8_HELGE|nr:hypothetical protein [Heliomicrobium gestii]MBM7865200.1 hypothetical protein [Heliomicrobium gestii]MZP41468.1 hypothetical protein [Heliomicrobium gestii]